MRFEKMELNIYREYLQNVEKGSYNGLLVLEELQKGDYLNRLECHNLNPELFREVSVKVKRDMEEGMLKEIESAPFFVRSRIRNAKYGGSVLGISINKNVVTSVNKRVAQLNKILEESKNKDVVLISKLTAWSSQQSPERRTKSPSLEIKR